MEDHQAAGALFLAETGDFMAVPDPRSYAIVPYVDKTARVHAYMMKEEGGVWDGCPRGKVDALVELYRAEGLSVQIAFEPEFTLYKKKENEYTPVASSSMFALAGLELQHDFLRDVVDYCAQMGVPVTQIGKEYGQGQYEGGILHGDPITAIDRYLIYKDAVQQETAYTFTSAFGMPLVKRI